ncbi:G5 domain-containing protein [Krasilnikovia sp. MM14-A1259]|uniref:G5 domain-containing protein n=1 Tax=Krasilnikovia sp. MM14-A1259 TaxID=3373539 RepID=UPI00399D18D8
MTAGTCALLAAIGGSIYGIAAASDDEPSSARAEPVSPAASGAGRPAPSGSAAAPGSAVPPGAAAAPGTRAVTPVGGGVGATAALGGEQTGENAAGAPIARVPNRTVTTGPPRNTAPHPQGGGGQAVFTQTVRMRTVTERRIIPFRTRFVRDRSLPRGHVRERRAGMAGLRSLRFLVTFVAGRETHRRLLEAAVTRQPRDRIIAVGSRGHGGHKQCRRVESVICIPAPRQTPCSGDDNGQGDHPDDNGPGQNHGVPVGTTPPPPAPAPTPSPAPGVVVPLPSGIVLPVPSGGVQVPAGGVPTIPVPGNGATDQPTTGNPAPVPTVSADPVPPNPSPNSCM